MHPNKLNSPVFFFKFVLGAFLLAFVLGLPAGITAWFDGLPWTGETETLVLSVVIPFLLILGWRFLSLRFVVLFRLVFRKWMGRDIVRCPPVKQSIKT